ncbi:plasmid partitioning/stability family protein [Rosenbergiella collisarenosi]|uniref:plasmid partitioning/stability family protein n=1 Tax=Rosenbergiella collisarenosi TaxID=1544695 RepID=UPI001F4DD27F|nr:plasmid partitioning/stability family protein [Rosenbergiella collisarenosi]
MSTAARKKIHISFNPEINKVDQCFFDLLEKLDIKDRGDVYRQSLLTGLLLLEKHPNILKAVSFVAEVSESPTWDQVQDILNVAKPGQEKPQGISSSITSIPTAVAKTEKKEPESGLSEATKKNAYRVLGS